MAKRGRPSAAAMEIASPLQTIARLRPSYDLTDEETEVWVAVTENWPADWFTPATAPLLTQYCRHTIRARQIAELIEKATGDPDLAIKDFDRLLKMQERESRAIASLATKMRISQQSTTNHRGNQKIINSKKPWEG